MGNLARGGERTRLYTNACTQHKENILVTIRKFTESCQSFYIKPASISRTEVGVARLKNEKSIKVLRRDNMEKFAYMSWQVLIQQNLQQDTLISMAVLGSSKGNT